MRNPVDAALGVTTLLKTAYRSFIYHRTEKPRIVETREDFDAAMAEGWADTPAAFAEQARAQTTVKRGRKWSGS
jgi:hypothetical protein